MQKRNETEGLDKRMLNINEAAAYIGMGTRKTREYMDEIGATRKIGSRILFDKKVIDAALDTISSEGYNEIVVRSAQ